MNLKVRGNNNHVKKTYRSWLIIHQPLLPIDDIILSII